MSDAYSWSASDSPRTSVVKGFKADVASVGRMWVAAAYDDLHRAGPDRARQVRRILDSYVVPWFGPQTDTVGDITYPMVHEWLLMLVGRRQRAGRTGRSRRVFPPSSTAGTAQSRCWRRPGPLG